RLAAGLLDGVHHLACRRGIAASAVDAGADVVDDDLRSMRREQQRMLASKSPSGSRDDGYPTFTKRRMPSSLLPMPVAQQFGWQWAWQASPQAAAWPTQ